ncbi:S41 family peptidase [Corynebacterium glaucum]|uniref:S41 family peptidase n=1 Tax=Corynebacterium glaucum TaxID=187491 RepID=UPI0026595848|nr:S41 family peptidase [Corynebacterium glaucum]
MSRTTRTRKVGAVVGAVLLVLALLFAAAAYFLGPALTAQTTGTARFFGTDTPKRYARTVLDLSESMGLYGDSEEFAAARAEVEAAMGDAATREELYDVLDSAVRAAGGKHSRLLPPGVEGGGDDGGEDELPSVRDEDELPSVRDEEGVTAASVPSVSRLADGQTYADILTRGLVEARDSGSCGVLVDLRGNGGGDMGPMVAGLSPLLPDGPALHFIFKNSENPVNIDGNSATGGGTATSTEGGKWETPVAVLVDGDTASSGEATMLAFRGLDYSSSFGSPTAGYASANMIYDFPDGSALMLTVAKDKARTGEEFSEDPIQPDVVTDQPEQDARGWLAERCGVAS